VTGSRASESETLRDPPGPGWPSPALHPPFTVFWIYFYVSSSSLRGSVGGSGTISVTENTVDTYRSVLFTAQSSLRDVGVPISVASAVILPLAWRTAFTNSRGPGRTLCEPPVSLSNPAMPLRSAPIGSMSLLSCRVIVKNSLPSSFRRHMRSEGRERRVKRMIQFRFSSMQFHARARGFP